MKPREFDIYKELLREQSGLELTTDKSYILDSRLSPIAKKWGYNNVESMTSTLIAVPDEKLVNEIIEAMSETGTSFFRDKFIFDTIKDTIFPYISENNASQRSLRIWCNTCSSGQEAYSLAMLLKENSTLFSNWKIEIIASDMSETQLTKAIKGTFSQFEVQIGLPIEYLIKYFTKKDDKWHINKDIKSMVSFRKFNLMDSMDDLEKFDIVFCRNAISSFENDTKTKVVNGLSKVLKPSGFLFLGKEETLPAEHKTFLAISSQKTIYALKGHALLTKAA